ncbi:Agnestins biosynthesis cluster transcription factor AgnL11 like protein [Verticillium longisporum]|uniref:Agnestins biosynthesis cluster transcription factor AgnL11 like protein n=1 Tax=Verticillium longisporum TaxID=100787 RepID=A0A8I2ZIG5_VERLO|nr:Agnestins biosynthesis cluster transcription factor AgnL11 like protein [Verticillium longisporum]
MGIISDRSRCRVHVFLSVDPYHAQNVRGGKSAATRLSLADDAHEDELQFLASLKQGLQDASDLELLGQQVQRRIDNLESGLPMTPAGSIIATTQYDAAPSPGEAIASGMRDILDVRRHSGHWSTVLVNAKSLAFDDSLIELQFRKLTEILYEEDFLQHPSMFSVQAITLVTRLGHNLGLSQVTGNLLGAAHGIARAGSVRLARSDWLEQIEIEVGKRTWWQLVIQDYFSIPFTETYAIHPAQFTTPIPRNCNDDDLIEKDNTAMTSTVIVLGLELLHQSSHSSEAAIEYRQLLSKAGERLRKRACDVLAAKCATLIEVLLSVEEELVIKVMRMRDGTIEEKQREAIDELIASQDILAKFLDLDPVFGMRPMFWESPAASEAWDPAVLYDVEQFEDFDVWYNEVFSGVAY